MCIKESGKLTVYFDSPFWVGLFEEISNGKIARSKIVFGSEPKDYEIFDFILKNYYDLKFSKPIPIDNYNFERRIKPKRLQRLIKKQTQEVGIGTKAQQALKAGYEENKLARKQKSRLKKEQLEREKYHKKQAKKKLKKRGH